MVELESGRSSMGGQEGGILPANHHLPSLDHHLGQLCLSLYAEQSKYVVSSRGNILSQFNFCFLALKFRSSREMSQEWSGWRSMSGHWWRGGGCQGMSGQGGRMPSTAATLCSVSVTETRAGIWTPDQREILRV